MTDDTGIKEIAPSNGSEKDKQTKEHENPDEWKSVVGDKFKSPTDVAKAYKELEKKLGESSEEIRKTREFAEVINPLLEEIRNDPKLFAELDERLRKKANPDKDKKPDADKDSKATEKDEIRIAASDLIIAKFEKDHSIDTLPADERKDLRRRIGDEIFELTGKTLANLDLRRLGPTLEKVIGYVLANKDNPINKSTLEALTSAHGNDEGAISSIRSSKGESEESLTPEEANVAEKLGLTRKQYLEGKKSPAKR